jgi:hypothetical protein
MNRHNTLLIETRRPTWVTKTIPTICPGQASLPTLIIEHYRFFVKQNSGMVIIFLSPKGAFLPLRVKNRAFRSNSSKLGSNKLLPNFCGISASIPCAKTA